MSSPEAPSALTWEAEPRSQNSSIDSQLVLRRPPERQPVNHSRQFSHATTLEAHSKGAQRKQPAGPDQPARHPPSLQMCCLAPRMSCCGRGVHMQPETFGKPPPPQLFFSPSQRLPHLLCSGWLAFKGRRVGREASPSPLLLVVLALAKPRQGSSRRSPGESRVNSAAGQLENKQAKWERKPRFPAEERRNARRKGEVWRTRRAAADRRPSKREAGQFEHNTTGSFPSTPLPKTKQIRSRRRWPGKSYLPGLAWLAQESAWLAAWAEGEGGRAPLPPGTAGQGKAGPLPNCGRLQPAPALPLLSSWEGAGAACPPDRAGDPCCARGRRKGASKASRPTHTPTAAEGSR